MVGGTFLALVLLLSAWILLGTHSRSGWGSTDAERLASLPGDSLIPECYHSYTRGITIDAGADDVWPWLVQIGQGRGGFYSYDWLENLFGLNIHSAVSIDSSLQRLSIGDPIRLAPDSASSLFVTVLEPNRVLLLASPDPRDTPDYSPVTDAPVLFHSTWGFYLHDQPGGSCRLLVRSRFEIGPSTPLRAAYRLLLEPANFIMERKMLGTLKKRVEMAHPFASRELEGSEEVSL